MFRICALTVASFTVMALGAGVASPASMKSNSTGTVGGDWDIDTEQLSTERQDRGSLDSQFFHVDGASQAEGAGQTEITGRVHDDYGQPATNVELRIEGHPARTIVPGQAWFESGREPVYAAGAPDAPTSFIRVSILPRAIRGNSSIMYVDPEDAKRGRPRQYTVFVDEPIDLA